MDFPFTQFRATLFTTAHQISDIISIGMNGLLLYLIVFQTSKSFRSYSIILASVTLSEFFLGLTAGLATARIIPINYGLIFQFHGLCRKVSPQFCATVHSLTLHCIAYGYSLLPLSFWYRHYVLSNKAPSPKFIAFLCFLIYLPAFITMIPFASSTSDPAIARQMLIDHQNGSLFPDDPKIAAIIGYENILQSTTMPLLALLCLPIFPGYTTAIIYRIQILRVLEKDSMSPKTKMAQKKLVKALTSIDLRLETISITVSSINPCITVYYVTPYREKVIQIFGHLRRKREIYKIHDHSNASSRNTMKDTHNKQISTQITSQYDLT